MGHTSSLSSACFGPGRHQSGVRNSRVRCVRLSRTGSGHRLGFMQPARSLPRIAVCASTLDSVPKKTLTRSIGALCSIALGRAQPHDSFRKGLYQHGYWRMSEERYDQMARWHLLTWHCTRELWWRRQRPAWCPLRHKNLFQWVKQPNGDVTHGTVYVDGSRIDGEASLAGLCARHGWAMVIFDSEGSLQASAKERPPAWASSI